MKKNLFVLIAMFAACTTASAQYFDPKNWDTTYHELDGGGWSTVWAEFNPVTFNVDVKGEDNQNATGISLGYSMAFPLMSDGGLFLEPGLGIQYTFYNEDEKADGIKSEDKFNMWSLKVPVNLLYKFQLGNNGFSLSPFAGLTLRYNMSAQVKNETTAGGMTVKTEANLFKNSDMGGSDYTWNRFQIGWQAGLKAIIGDVFMIGASYGTDFTEISKKTKLQTATVMIGVCF